MRAGIRRRAGGETGSSAIEFVLYTPLIFLAIFLVVQFGLLYLGNQTASAAAREAARVARNGGSDADALRAARQWADTVGRGVFTPTRIEVTRNGRTQLVRVEGHGLQIVPNVPLPGIVEVVQGPVEEFRADDTSGP